MILSRWAVQAAPKARIRRAWPAWTCRECRVHNAHTSRRGFVTIPRQMQAREKLHQNRNLDKKSDSQAAVNLSQNVLQEEKDHFHRIEEHSKERQRQSPWMREGSDMPPVTRNRSAGAMTKGKLLTTPSRMLKLIIPLTIRDKNKDGKDIEPLALLVHPQQPLSYLERLIQSDLPPLQGTNGERAPNIHFRALDTTDETDGKSKSAVEDSGKEEDYDLEDAEETVVDGKLERTGKLKGKSPSQAPKDAGGKTSSCDLDKFKLPNPEINDHSHPNFIRWSPSTEIGDFIRDAARGKEFAIDIEGTSAPIYVGVPSFHDRTYYLRMRLRKTAKRISSLADVKRECDRIAQRGAKRVAQGGFVGLLAWWGTVYFLTFKTDLGWDVMEPITYLVGLTGLMGGYMWFLYHNREVSYRSAMNFTISRRQSQLYDQKGFNIEQWEGLVEEGNRLRREIKMIADEYDAAWDESKDEGDEKVREALRKARERNGKKDGKEKESDESDDD